MKQKRGFYVDNLKKNESYIFVYGERFSGIKSAMSKRGIEVRVERVNKGEKK